MLRSHVQQHGLAGQARSENQVFELVDTNFFVEPCLFLCVWLAQINFVNIECKLYFLRTKRKIPAKRVFIFPAFG